MHTVTIAIRAYQDTAGSKPYADWLESLTDNKTKARIVARISRVAAGNFGDCKPLRDGVVTAEPKLHVFGRYESA